MTDMAEATDFQPMDPRWEDVVYDLAVSPDFERDGICFAACASGLRRSEDGGRTWEDAYASLQLEVALPTAAVAVSPNFKVLEGGAVLESGAAEGSVFAGAPGGVLHSMDGGRTWYVANLPSPPPFVSALAVSPNHAHDGTLLAGTLEDGVFRSGDGGRRFAAWNFGLLDLNVLCMAISPDYARDETLFVGTESGVFRSTNGGRAWREVAFAPEFAPVLSLALSPRYASDGVLFAGTEAHGLFRSADAGRTWLPMGREAMGEAVNRVLLSPGFPDRPHVLALLADALLISRDGGETWASWEAEVPAERGMACVAAPQGLAPGAPLLVGLADGEVVRI
jgi:photosystem II stability/assembly factor-like uncharacterized protein